MRTVKSSRTNRGYCGDRGGRDAADIPGAHAAVALTQIIVDPFTNTTSQHQTAVEPDTFAFGNTIVTAAQTGRFFDGGASDIGYATSTNGGTSWTAGCRCPASPRTTAAGAVRAGQRRERRLRRQAQRVADLLDPDHLRGHGADVIVSRSTDGGLTFGNPVTVASGSTSFDKNWTVCDNTPTSPFYGHCYTEFDDNADGDREKMSTSTDGGLTWGPALNTGNNATGLGGQPVVQPNGTVIVPAATANETGIRAFRSTNGGASWTSTVTVVRRDRPRRRRRACGPDRCRSAEIDAAGKVYVAWQDCRFRSGCKSNDIVMSTSTDGVTWSPVSRVPIDATTQHRRPLHPWARRQPHHLGHDRAARSDLLLLPDAAAAAATCQLEVGYIQSTNGGSTWTPTRRGRPVQLRCSPRTPARAGWSATTSRPPGSEQGHSVRSRSPRRRPAHSPSTRRSTCRPAERPRPPVASSTPPAATIRSRARPPTTQHQPPRSATDSKPQPHRPPADAPNPARTRPLNWRAATEPGPIRHVKSHHQQQRQHVGQAVALRFPA